MLLASDAQISHDFVFPHGHEVIHAVPVGASLSWNLTSLGTICKQHQKIAGRNGIVRSHRHISEVQNTFLKEKFRSKAYVFSEIKVCSSEEDDDNSAVYSIHEQLV